MKAGGVFSDKYFVAPLFECERRAQGLTKQRLSWWDSSDVLWDPDEPVKQGLFQRILQVLTAVHC